MWNLSIIQHTAAALLGTLSWRNCNKDFGLYRTCSTSVILQLYEHLDHVKQIWYLSHMPAAKVQASLRIRTVSPEPPLLAHTSNESRGTFMQKARSLASLNGWACAVKICHDGMLEDTNSLDAAHFVLHVNPFSCICLSVLDSFLPFYRKLEFVKHYTPNICLPLNTHVWLKFAVPKFHKTFWTLLQSLTGNLHIIPYQLTKFQTPTQILLTRLKCPLQRAITQKNWTEFVQKLIR